MHQVVVPPREARALRVPAGTRFRVIDIEGGQVGDLFAFRADDVSEYASAEHTRPRIGRLFPAAGEKFLTNHRRPILTLEEDHSPGVHDMLYAACDPSRYASLGYDGWHASCEENLREAMAGLGCATIEIPQPINLFMSVGVDAEGTLTPEPSPTKPGDFVQLVAESDCYVVLSSCPMDLVEISSGGLTALAIEVID